MSRSLPRSNAPLRYRETLRHFSTELFGWNVAAAVATNYGLLSDGGGHPIGGIGKASEGNPNPPGVVVYLPVDDVDEAEIAARGLGAKVAIRPWEIPGLSRMVLITDPEGNRIGLCPDHRWLIIGLGF